MTRLDGVLAGSVVLMATLGGDALLGIGQAAGRLCLAAGAALWTLRLAAQRRSPLAARPGSRERTRS